ncbi:MAG: D-alanyl-D-alanine carboxypeptidase family protein [Steroidobacteraceae bacterium]
MRRLLRSFGLVVLGAGLAPLAAAVPVPKPPSIEAKAFILIDYASGRVLAENTADARMEPASLTKVMTAYVVFRALREKRLKLDDAVTISEHAWRSEGSRTFVEVGKQVPVEMLIQGMIVQSGNDASIALAEKVGGTESAFVEMMNTYAKGLGMNATHFADSSGLPGPGHYTTARDMATLARALIRDFPDYYHYYSLHDFLWNNIRQENRNGLLLSDPSVDGIKTGHTETAGYCLMTSANRNGMRLISVVLGSPSIKAREGGSAALLNYGYTFYESAKIKSARELVLKPRVYKGGVGTVGIGPAQDAMVTVPRGDAATLRTSARVNDPLIAPLALNQAVGELTVIGPGGDVVLRVALYPLTAVAVGGWWSRLVDTVALWFH